MTSYRMTRMLQSTLFKCFPQLIRQIDVLLVVIHPITPPPFTTLTAAILPTSTISRCSVICFSSRCVSYNCHSTSCWLTSGVIQLPAILPAAVPSAVFPTIVILPVVALPSGVIQLRYCHCSSTNSNDTRCFSSVLFLSCVFNTCYSTIYYYLTGWSFTLLPFYQKPVCILPCNSTSSYSNKTILPVVFLTNQIYQFAF